MKTEFIEEKLKYIGPKIELFIFDSKGCIITASGGGFTPGQDTSNEFGLIT